MKFFAPLRLLALLALTALWLMTPAQARDQAAEPRKPIISVLLPLQLDSLFELDKYRFGNNIPRFVLPYLEFYNGVLLAADSLRKEGLSVHINIVDSRKLGSMQVALANPLVSQSKLLIGVAANVNELRQMAEFAKAKRIPLLSATLPNDGGIKYNNMLYVLNPTMRTHCAALYGYLQAQHGKDNVILLTRKGTTESYLKNWLEAAANKSAMPVRWKTSMLVDSFSIAQLLPLLDSTRQNILIGASMDLKFAGRLAQQVASAKRYKCTLVGMPNWDELSMNKAEYKGLELVFGTAFLSASGNLGLYIRLSKQYSQLQNSKPSDMVLRGYETTLRYARAMVLADSVELPDLFNNRAYRVFNDFNFQPAIEGGENQIHYFENRKVHFLKLVDGQLKGVY